MKVSILLITYNHALYIEDAIRSILMQKHDYEAEIIILDDCSSDETVTIAKVLLKDAVNAQVIRNEANLGITKNYQKGFSLCTGEYVVTLEGDDYWLDAHKIQNQVAFLERYPFHSMCFHPFLIQEDVSRKFTPFVLPNGIIRNSNPDSYTIRDLIFSEGLIGTFSVCCYRKKWLEQLPSALFDVTAYDWAVNLFMAHFGLLGRIDKVMAVYRLADKATWSTKSQEEKSQTVLGLIPQYDRLLSFKYSNLFSEKINNITKIESLSINEASSIKLGKQTILVDFIKRVINKLR